MTALPREGAATHTGSCPAACPFQEATAPGSVGEGGAARTGLGHHGQATPRPRWARGHPASCPRAPGATRWLTHERSPHKWQPVWNPDPGPDAPTGRPPGPRKATKQEPGHGPSACAFAAPEPQATAGVVHTLAGQTGHRGRPGGPGSLETVPGRERRPGAGSDAGSALADTGVSHRGEGQQRHFSDGVSRGGLVGALGPCRLTGHLCPTRRGRATLLPR